MEILENFDGEAGTASVWYDGHVTIMKFTTGWKVMYGTPNMSDEDRKRLADLPGKMGLEQAISVAKTLNRGFKCQK